MARLQRHSAKRPERADVIGRRSFARISAVEGIHLTPEMERMFAEFDRKGLSAAERRKIIAQKYGKRR